MTLATVVVAEVYLETTSAHLGQCMFGKSDGFFQMSMSLVNVTFHNCMFKFSCLLTAVHHSLVRYSVEKKEIFFGV